MPHPVIHFEVHGSDAKKSQEFYASVFGWDIDANNPLNYGMVAKGGDTGITGGITGGKGATMATFYVEVEDLEATLQLAESKGAKRMMGPEAIEGGPTIAMFADPDGNVIGLTKADTM
jgi:predicted enzyme related to lactoylglutathione lyase